MTDRHQVDPIDASHAPRSEWEARRWMHMRGARTCRKLMRKAERADLPTAVTYYERHIRENVAKARRANRAALWHARQR